MKIEAFESNPSVTPFAELIRALNNGGNTPKNRRRAVMAIVTEELDQKTQSALVDPVTDGWRRLGAMSGDSKNPSSVIIPDSELETGDLFK